MIRLLKALLQISQNLQAIRIQGEILHYDTLHRYGYNRFHKETLRPKPKYPSGYQEDQDYLDIDIVREIEEELKLEKLRKEGKPVPEEN